MERDGLPAVAIEGAVAAHLEVLRRPVRRRRRFDERVARVVPCTGSWGTPGSVGASMPVSSRMVGAMSMTEWNCDRTPPHIRIRGQ